MTISSCFSKLLSGIEPRDTDIRLYDSHKSSVKTRLESVFQTNRVEQIGSYSRGSAIRDTSDIDLMLILSVNEVRWGDKLKSSSTILNQVREQLQGRYYSTDVGRDGQAVVVRFADNKHPVDVVPAVYTRHGGVKNYPIYAIPNGSGGWMDTSPQAHNKFINDADDRSGGKLKRTAMLIKFWRRCRQPKIPLSSFHLELLLAVEGTCVGPKSYAVCMNDALVLLSNRQCESLVDPVGVSGGVPSANTEAKKQQLRQAVSSSADRTYKACISESRGDFNEAYRLWDLVFNGYFPRG
ncbi:MAG: hypothetical protein JOZ96_11630 [Acidobacteria bacterium]|nr:hypothetical protein [Acidobacteriota bacterium]